MTNGPKTWVIGRHSDCDIIVSDETVSRFHCELVATTDHQLFLSNRNSSGLWVARNNAWLEWSTPDYVLREEYVLLGNYQTTIGGLLQQVGS